MSRPWWKFWQRDVPAPPDPVTQAVDPVDGYDPTRARLDGLERDDPARDPEVFTALALQAHNDAAASFERGRISLDAIAELRQSLFDGYVNTVTGLGDWTRDKSLGGNPLGPDFLVRIISGVEAEERWRGADLGKRIVETLPTEMVRRGWTVAIQPADEDAEVMDDARVAFRRLHARMVARGDSAGLVRLQRSMRELALDDLGLFGGAPAPPKEPGPLPESDDSGQRVVEWLKNKCESLRAATAFGEALNYRQAYGGGAVFIGVDDGESDLTQPLDWRKVRRVTHLQPFRGGWDGELLAWRYRNDPRLPRYGEPEMYMLRNMGIPLGSPPAPGEQRRLAPLAPVGPMGGLVSFVHASRLLVFPGQQVSSRVRVVMRGWSDSIFTRVDEVLAQYGQTWSGLAILLNEASLKIVSITDGAQLFASGKAADREKLRNRAIAMQMMESIAKTKFIDAKEKFERVEVGTLAGMADVLREMALRVSATVNIPLSRLMGQTQGGLGDASKGDQRDFYDYVAGEQERELTPLVRRLHRGLMVTPECPTGGTLPKRWDVEMRPLMQMNDTERATYRKLIADTDKIYVDMGAVSAEEVAATRFGGSDYNDGPIVIDVEGRAKMAELKPPPPAGTPALPPGAPKPSAALGAPGSSTATPSPGTPAAPPAPPSDRQPAAVAVPPDDEDEKP